jgi:hypothetical protein
VLHNIVHIKTPACHAATIFKVASVIGNRSRNCFLPRELFIDDSVSMAPSLCNDGGSI